MTRLTIIGFLLLSGFFYLTGRPIDQNADQEFAAQLTRGVESGSPLAPRAGQASAGTLVAATDAQMTPTAGRLAEPAALPDLPTRKPARQPQAIAQLATEVARPAQPTVTETAAAEAKSESGAVAANGTTPLFKSMQERYAAPKPAVLGPRLTAVLIKRELRRVGCYDGNITGIWDDGARQAIERYNSQSGSRINADAPDVATLEALQRLTEPACTDAGANGTTVAAATGAGTAAGAIAAMARNDAATERASSWQGSEPRKSIAYQPPSPGAGVLVSSLEDGTQAQEQSRVYRLAPAREPRRRAARSNRVKGFAVAQPFFKAKSLVKSWKSYAPSRRFGFTSRNGSFTLNY